ncbi:YceI family protein [Sphingobacterium sp. SYP-B4668]|uniref:YceI family protein n=1 Tax=Sphingobacterium sp. SYP-B4668 TaxID=2996035 RepID=UPI0022DE74BE|nr:YceI family protein [Sphingobacterium sp. SYP-B4668]
MNRIYFLPVFLLMFSCIGKHTSDAPKAIVNPVIENSEDVKADTLRMNVQKSVIHWIATEMRGARRRTGIFSFKNGFFLTRNDELVGGNFIVAMETIDVTDMPTHEIIARNNLLNHLKSVDFFNIVEYPQSVLELTNIQKVGSDSLRISGNLSIREVTKNIKFFAYQKDSVFRANFTFNRFDWNIAYEGSWADKTLVDKDVELIIEIITEPLSAHQGQ